MHVQLRFLRERATIQEVLQIDGWDLAWETDDSLTARHPLVHDETAARNRLHYLGLLTTGSAHIEFHKQSYPQRRNGRRLC
jgi:hypothetical protein